MTSARSTSWARGISRPQTSHRSPEAVSWWFGTAQRPPGDDGDGDAVVGRRVDTDGNPAGPELQVNSTTVYSQRVPRVSSWGDGSFVVSWVTPAMGNKGLVPSLRGRPFDATGAPSGGDFQVTIVPNIYTTIVGHDLETGASGEFVVAVSEFYNSYTGFFSSSLASRRHDITGSLLSQDLLSSGGAEWISPRLDGDVASSRGSGEFVVAWHLETYGFGYVEIQAACLDATGIQVGSRLEIFGGTDSIGGDSAAPALGPDGDFVVAWSGFDFVYGSTERVYGQRVDAANQPAPGGPQQVNAFAGTSHRGVGIARGGDGGLLAVWQALEPPGDPGTGILGRYLAADGTPVAEEFAVNASTAGDQLRPVVEAAADGRSFLVAWQSEAGDGTDGDGFSIRARRVISPGIFADGFESGDLDAWSSSGP
ncbi:MAG: hypothetical protein AAGN66_20990 [Acidobacteriota bacterium]